MTFPLPGCSSRSEAQQQRMVRCVRARPLHCLSSFGVEFKNHKSGARRTIRSEDSRNMSPLLISIPAECVLLTWYQEPCSSLRAVQCSRAYHFFLFQTPLQIETLLSANLNRISSLRLLVDHDTVSDSILDALYSSDHRLDCDVENEKQITWSQQPHLKTAITSSSAIRRDLDD